MGACLHQWTLKLYQQEPSYWQICPYCRGFEWGTENRGIPRSSSLGFGLWVNNPNLLKNNVDISPTRLMRQSEKYRQIEEHSWDSQGLRWAVLSEKKKKSVKIIPLNHWQSEGSTVMKRQYCTSQSQQLGIILQVMSFIQVAYFGLFDVIIQYTSPLHPEMCRRMKCGFFCTKSSCNCDVIPSSKVLRCLHIAVSLTTLLLTLHCAVACRQTPWLVNYIMTLIYLLTVACHFPSAGSL